MVDGDITIVKKSTAYLLVQTEHIKMVDLLNYTGPQSYRSMTRELLGRECKGVFCYEAVEKLEDLNKPLPDYSSFFDTSRGFNLCEEDYLIFQFAKENQFKEQNLTDEQIAEKLKMLCVPSDGPTTYNELRKEWESRGYTTMKQICEAYISDDTVCVCVCANHNILGTTS